MKKGVYPWTEKLTALLAKTPPELNDYKELESFELQAEIEKFKQSEQAKYRGGMTSSQIDDEFKKAQIKVLSRYQQDRDALRQQIENNVSMLKEPSGAAQGKMDKFVKDISDNESQISQKEAEIKKKQAQIKQLRGKAPTSSEVTESNPVIEGSAPPPPPPPGPPPAPPPPTVPKNKGTPPSTDMGAALQKVQLKKAQPVQDNKPKAVDMGEILKRQAELKDAGQRPVVPKAPVEKAPQISPTQQALEMLLKKANAADIAIKRAQSDFDAAKAIIMKFGDHPIQDGAELQKHAKALIAEQKKIIGKQNQKLDELTRAVELLEQIEAAKTAVPQPVQSENLGTESTQNAAPPPPPPPAPPPPPPPGLGQPKPFKATTKVGPKQEKAATSDAPKQPMQKGQGMDPSIMLNNPMFARRKAQEQADEQEDLKKEQKKQAQEAIKQQEKKEAIEKLLQEKGDVALSPKEQQQARSWQQNIEKMQSRNQSLDGIEVPDLEQLAAELKAAQEKKVEKASSPPSEAPKQTVAASSLRDEMSKRELAATKKQEVKAKKREKYASMTAIKPPKAQEKTRRHSMGERPFTDAPLQAFTQDLKAQKQSTVPKATDVPPQPVPPSHNPVVSPQDTSRTPSPRSSLQQEPPPSPRSSMRQEPPPPPSVTPSPRASMSEEQPKEPKKTRKAVQFSPIDKEVKELEDWQKQRNNLIQDIDNMIVSLPQKYTEERGKKWIKSYKSKDKQSKDITKIQDDLDELRKKMYLAPTREDFDSARSAIKDYLEKTIQKRTKAAHIGSSSIARVLADGLNELKADLDKEIVSTRRKKD